MDNDEIGERLRQAADSATASMPSKHPGPDFYARVGRPEPKPRRYVTYALAAAAAILVVVFGIVALRDPGPVGVETVRPPPTQPPATVTTSPQAVDPVAVQLAADAQTAETLGLTIGELVYAPDGTVSLGDQPDLVPLVLDGELIGYSKPVEILDDQAPADLVYGPDGVTVRGVIDSSGEFLPSGDS